MDEKWETRVKKLALAYRTGWQYRPGSAEAGSVLTDIFLDMERENKKRFAKIWEKHKRKFLGAVPKAGREAAHLKTALTVKANEKSDGAWLSAGTVFYTVPGEGNLIRFRTVSPVLLTAANLSCAVYRDGFYAWLTYGGEEGNPAILFVPEGKELARPKFRWSFSGLCDGRGQFSFFVKFKEAPGTLPQLGGEWSIRSGQSVIPVQCLQDKAGISLCGESREFLEKFDSSDYELCLETDGEPGEEWLAALYGGFALEEKEETFSPKPCLTEDGCCKADRVLPFGHMLTEAACCYLACDRAVAGRSGQVTMHFWERYEKEETLPPPVPAGDEKIYKKYPWLRREEEILDWLPQESVWEYFNGNFWCPLPGSEAWQTGCHLQGEGEKEYRFEKPTDMESCLVEGEEHYFIRLRLVRVKNPYAVYHRKYIPVLEEIRFFVEGRRLYADQCILPERGWAGERKMYLGFDREVTTGQCWYTGEGEFFFRQEQILGWDTRFGRKAFWVELSEDGAGRITELCPNYVKVQRIPVEGDGENEEENQTPEKIAAGSRFFAETKEFGVLEAVSRPDRCDGAWVEQYGMGDQMAGEESALPDMGGKTVSGNYFSHCGRVVTQMDLTFYMTEKYPQIRLVSCSFSEDGTEFFVTVKDGGGAGSILPELEEWIAGILCEAGGLWFEGVRVKCSLAEI